MKRQHQENEMISHRLRDEMWDTYIRQRPYLHIQPAHRNPWERVIPKEKWMNVWTGTSQKKISKQPERMRKGTQLAAWEVEVNSHTHMQGKRWIAKVGGGLERMQAPGSVLHAGVTGTWHRCFGRLCGCTCGSWTGVFPTAEPFCFGLTACWWGIRVCENSVALLVIAPSTCKPACPFTAEWETYHTARKRSKLLLLATTYVNLINNGEGKKLDTKQYLLSGSIHIKFKNKQNHLVRNQNDFYSERTDIVSMKETCW